jgi:hypothetical protein
MASTLSENNWGGTDSRNEQSLAWLQKFLHWNVIRTNFLHSPKSKFDI